MIAIESVTFNRIQLARMRQVLIFELNSQISLNDTSPIGVNTGKDCLSSSLTHSF